MCDCRCGFSGECRASRRIARWSTFWGFCGRESYRIVEWQISKTAFASVDYHRCLRFAMSHLHLWLVIRISNLSSREICCTRVRCCARVRHVFARGMHAAHRMPVRRDSSPVKKGALQDPSNPVVKGAWHRKGIGGIFLFHTHALASFPVARFPIAR